MKPTVIIAAPPSSVPPVWPALLCIAIPCVASFVPVLGFGVWLIAVPMLLVAFILAVVTMTRGAAMSGLVVLFLTLIVAPVVILCGPFIGTSLGVYGADWKKAQTAPTAAVEAERLRIEEESRRIDAPEFFVRSPSEPDAPPAPASPSPALPMVPLAGPELAAAQRRAVAAFPSLAVQGSPLNSAFVVRAKSKPPEFFASPDWPSELAAEIESGR